jgi:putative FmdB family regulatory protein
MPTYSYRCSACANEFDQFQRFTDEPLTECPTCGGGIRRVIQPVGVVFKGSGWYITDNRPKDSDSGGSSSSSSSKNAKSEKSESSTSPSSTSEKTNSSTGSDSKAEKAAASA